VLIWIQSGLIALMMIPVSSLSGLVMPALRAELSDRVAANQQGELQGALSSLHALGLIVTPLVYTIIFAQFTGERALIDLPGAVFALPLLLSLSALWLLWRPNRERRTA